MSTSFTEIALSNTTVLDWICPPNREKTVIDNQGDFSPLEVLANTLTENTQRDPFESPLRDRVKYYAFLPLGCVARSVYFLSVMTLIAPVGALYHASATLYHIGKYEIRVYQSSDLQSDSWEKVKSHVNYFFTDLCNFVYGGLILAALGPLTEFSVKYLWSVITKEIIITSAGEGIVTLFRATFPPSVLLFLSGGFTPSNFTSRLTTSFDQSDDLKNMYLALELRNQLGLVGPDGQLLQHKGKEFKKDYFWCLVGNVEVDLINKINEINKTLTKLNASTIEFKYPFNGYEEAENLKTLFKKEEGNPGNHEFQLSIDNNMSAEWRTLYHQIQNLERLQYKVNTLSLIFKEVMTLSSHPLFDLINRTTITFPLPPSALTENSYMSSFEDCNKSWDLTREIPSFHETIKNINIISNPQQINTPYEQFKSEIIKAKIILERNEEILPQTLIGLGENFTRDELKLAIRKYRRSLHPDKNGNSEESNSLFKLLNEIVNELEN